MVEKTKKDAECRSLKHQLDEMRIALSKEKSERVDVQARLEKLEGKNKTDVVELCAKVFQLTESLREGNENVVNLTHEHEKATSGRNGKILRARADLEEAQSQLEQKDKELKDKTAQLEVTLADVAEKEERARLAEEATSDAQARFESERCESSVTLFKQRQSIDRLRKDKRWLLEEGTTHLFESIKQSKAHNDLLHALAEAADAAGKHDGLAAGYKWGMEGKDIKSHPFFKESAYTGLPMLSRL